MARRRILIFTNSFRIGGSEGQALQLIKHIDRSKFEVHVACFDHEGPLLEQLPSDVGDVAAFPLTGFVHPGTIRQAARFIALLRKTKIEIVQTFDLYTNVFGLPLARCAGVPVTVGSRRDHGVKRTVWQGRAEKWSFRLATQVVANAEVIKQRLVQERCLTANRLVVIRNGLDLSRFSNWKRADEFHRQIVAERVVFAVVANLRPEKGHLTFIRAAHRVASVYPAARFVLMGDGPMRAQIEDSIRALDLSDKVQLLGAVTDVPCALQSIDVVVSPSDTEGFPNAVLDGMAAAKPIVATDAGGTRELVDDGRTGYLVPVGDVEQLANRMIVLCQSPVTRRIMGEKARSIVEQIFTVEIMARRFESLYEKLSAAART